MSGGRPYTLADFVRESNRIENIHREPTEMEMIAHKEFLALKVPSVSALERFVDTVAPGKRLRDNRGMDVRVGNHIAPRGGPEIVEKLVWLLDNLWSTSEKIHTPYTVHKEYETLHPFMDGNGRSGRVLWLWMRGGIDYAPLGFLHHWYYESLDNSRG